ncbi:Uncharacterized conserved protein, DUF58 family, contains vWF domain [Psychrobacillus sp. OK028]|uniref:DUF58 domain-containing protein n=1 Tax=Psychrobacillus sp. OK028 TaxID=1884359 RepID=UPI0008916C60|nr:DUF58 domain-containing protein [Psychrobacillus sp. OK028]SDN70057.1 Uncharacterized conserved protein, DUF58 family, contains vWF domain [Psychrobacillus sp. OK028]
MKLLFNRWRRVRGVVGVLFLLVVAFVYAMFQGGFVSWFLFYLVIPISLYSILLYMNSLSDITVVRIIETRKVQSGGRFSATIHVNRKSRFPLMYVQLEEKVSPSLASQTSWKQLIFWGMRKEFSWTYEIEHIPRGEHVLVGTSMQVSDMFGWVKKEVFITNPKTILVFPNLTEMVYIPIETRYDQGAAASRIQAMKDTSMATGVRSYQPGDRVSWIHWKSFARTQTLKTKEFEDRQSQDMFVVIDRTPSPLFEEVVDLTASIMQAIVRHQASSAFLSVGSERMFLPEVQTDQHLQRVLYHLTKVQDDLTKPLDQVFLHDKSLSNATTLLYITSNLTYEWMDSVQKNATNLRACTCFVINSKTEKTTREQNAMYKYAASRGFQVQTITKDRFAQAFLEVKRT